MEQVLKIDADKAYQLYPNASSEMKEIFEATFGKEYFRRKITDRIQSFDDVTRLSAIDGEIRTCTISDNKAYKSVLALLKLLKIANAYNEGWVPNWNNSSECKYFPYYYKSAGSWLVFCGGWSGFSVYPSGVYFKTRELAEDALAKFRDVFDDYFMI